MFNSQPILESDLILVRPLRDEDYKDLFRAASDPQIWDMHAESNRHEPDTFAKYFSRIKSSGGGLAVVDKKSQKIIGASSFYKYDETKSVVSIGFSFLERNYWGGLYNKDLKKLMLNHAFKFVQSVHFYVGESNFRAGRALEKIGAVRGEGIAEATPSGTPLIAFVYKLERNKFASNALTK